MESLKDEAVVVQSPTAPQLKEVLEFLERFNDNPDFELLAVELFTLLERCFLPDQLKSITKGHMWSAFHQLRLSEQPKDAWRRFMAHSLLPAQHADQCLQLIIDRLFKRVITTKTKRLHKTSHTPPDDPKLSEHEDNVVYYMSGFVAFKLMRKYRKSSTDPELQTKWRYFVSVLEKMKAEEQVPCDDTVEDYCRAWTEHIDRGGLYYIEPKIS